MQHAKKRKIFFTFRCNYSNGREQVLSPMNIWVEIKLRKVFFQLYWAAQHHCHMLSPSGWHGLFDRCVATCVKTSQTLVDMRSALFEWQRNICVLLSCAANSQSVDSTTSETSAEPLTKRFFTQAAVVWQFGGFVPWWGWTAGVLNHNNTPPLPNHCAVVLLEGFPTYISWI